MRQVKIFGAGNGVFGSEESQEVSTTENDINKWLEMAGDIEITHILQFSADNKLLISIFYKTK